MVFKRSLIKLLALVAFSALATVALTNADAVAGRVLATVNPSGRTVVIPERAVEVAPGVFSLGVSVSDGRIVEGYAFVRYREGFHHRPGHGGGPPGGPGGGGDSQCFEFFAKSARWRTTEPYVLDTTNGAGLASSFVETTTSASLETWDAEVLFDIFGARDAGSSVDGADTVSPDGKNEIYFADIAEDGAIGVAIVWGIFRGRPSGRELLEHDVVFDDVDFTWGDADPTAMDYQNISTHEFGHSAGLADLYEVQCAEQTMYGLATEGETKKRDLAAGDIAGITGLYE